jgi:hypothetical protein
MGIRAKDSRALTLKSNAEEVAVVAHEMSTRSREALCPVPPHEDGHSLGDAKTRLEGLEPPLSQIRSLRLYPLSYRRLI